jgi:DNA (cytosine-5)-methyltransferase 1
MEQVPAVMPLWQHYARVLRGWGYSVDTGVLNAADHGLAQVRKRAVLVASRVREVLLPAPTHGTGLLPHLTMAGAIGWGYTRRPSPTLTGGGTYTGGPEPFGNGTRQAMRKAMLRDGEWAERGLPHLRPTVAEAAVLQGFPVGYPWFGRAGQVFQQCGNAIPVPLAAAVLAAATGIPLRDRTPVLAAVPA